MVHIPQMQATTNRCNRPQSPSCDGKKKHTNLTASELVFTFSKAKAEDVKETNSKKTRTFWNEEDA